MSSFFFPLLFVTPELGEQITAEFENFTLHARKWETTSFDFATLGAYHKLHLSYHLMEVLLGRCNMEVEVRGHDDREAAMREFLDFRLGLYVAGVSPFLCPLIVTHSINDYSGINSRDSDNLRDKLPEGLKAGLTSKTGIVTAWPFELSFTCQVVPGRLRITPDDAKQAAATAKKWQTIAQKSKTLTVAGEAATAAPKLGNADQSLLHIWTAIESLFPTVTAENNYRLAMYMAQLVSPNSDGNPMYKRMKDGYKVRSKVAHGEKVNVTMTTWCEAWSILMDAIKAIIDRGEHPPDDQLVRELLRGPKA